MSTVYLLTAALAFVPVMSQMVATALLIKGLALAGQPKAARRLPLWLPFTFSAMALMFTLWHTAHTIDVFFPDYSATDFETKIILGVSVPLEIADRVQSIVSEIPSILIGLFLISGCIWFFFVPRRALAQATAPVWVLRLLALVGLVYFSWTAWGSLGTVIANVQSL